MGRAIHDDELRAARQHRLIAVHREECAIQLGAIDAPRPPGRVGERAVGDDEDPRLASERLMGSSALVSATNFTSRPSGEMAWRRAKRPLRFLGPGVGGRGGAVQVSKELDGGRSFSPALELLLRNM